MGIPRPIARSAARRSARGAAMACLAIAFGLLPAHAQDSARLLQEAARLQTQGSHDQALAMLTEALNDSRLTNDRSAIILNDRGALLARMNQPKPAIDDLNRAVQLYPEYPAIYNNRGSILLTLGLAREAIKDFDRAILLAPGYVAAFNNRAGARLLLGQSDAAFGDFSRAIELAPGTVAPLLGRGKALIAGNRPQAALRDFSHALQADNRLALGYRSRADARLATDRTGEAIEDLSRAIAFDPNNADIYIERGHAYMQADNAAAALKDYARALELSPQSIGALEARALAHVLVDAHNEAEADFGRALELNPNATGAVAARAILYIKTGQPDLARRDIDRALKLTPRRAEVLLAKAQLDDTAGRRNDAIEGYRAALAARRSLRPAALALARLTGDGADAVELRGLGLDHWRVIRRSNRLFAISDLHPRVQVPLESIGDALPHIVEYEIKKPPYKDIAVLQYSVGQPPGSAEELHYAAILDLAQSSVLGVVPSRLGAKQANWSWEDSRLVVTSIDGLIDEFQVRGGRPQPVATAQPRRQYTEGPRTYAPPGWMPWGNAPPQQRRGQQRQPKTLFDILFGN